MNRRKFFNRISRAALAFSVAPGVFKILPAARRVSDAVRPTRASIAYLTPQALEALFNPGRNVTIEGLDDYLLAAFKIKRPPSLYDFIMSKK